MTTAGQLSGARSQALSETDIQNFSRKAIRGTRSEQQGRIDRDREHMLLIRRQQFKWATALTVSQQGILALGSRRINNKNIVLCVNEAAIPPFDVRAMVSESAVARPNPLSPLH